MALEGTPENEGQEQNITDLVNSLIEEPQEEQVDTQVATEQMRKSRTDGIKEYKKEVASSAVSEAKQATGTYKQKVSDLEAKISKMEKLLEESNRKIGMVEKQTESHSDRMLTDDVIAEERKLKDHNLYGKYYDPKEVRDFYLKAATEEKRYFSPTEALKIKKFDELAKKLEQYEKQDMNRQSLMEGVFSSSNQSVPQGDGLSDVNDDATATEWMRKKGRELGL